MTCPITRGAKITLFSRLLPYRSRRTANGTSRGKPLGAIATYIYELPPAEGGLSGGRS